jgi:hypothetical protein
MVRRWRLIGHFPILYNPSSPGAATHECCAGAATGDTLARTLSTFLGLAWDDDMSYPNPNELPSPPRGWMHDAQAAAAALVAAALGEALRWLDDPPGACAHLTTKPRVCAAFKP